MCFKNFFCWENFFVCCVFGWWKANWNDHNSMLENRLKMWKISGVCRNNIKAIQVISHASWTYKNFLSIFIFTLQHSFHSSPAMHCSMLCNFSIRLIDFRDGKESATAMEQSFLVILSASDEMASLLLLSVVARWSLLPFLPGSLNPEPNVHSPGALWMTIKKLECNFSPLTIAIKSLVNALNA
jgi:hypothetical protein